MAVIAAALCVFSAGTLSACSESGGTVDQNAVILTEDDYTTLKDDWFPLLSTEMNGDTRSSIKYITAFTRALAAAEFLRSSIRTEMSV